MKRLLYFIVLATIAISSVLSCQQEPEEIRVSSISLSKSTLELTVGDQVSLDVTISPDNATNKKISWSSSKESVATVTPEGIVEAVSAGTAFITATSEDSGVNAKCEIIVKEKVINVTGIALNKTSLPLTEGEEFTLEATVTPDNATNKRVTWTSNNEAVATVSAEGVVKAIKAGTANITASSKDSGVNAKCEITVKEKVISVTGIALSKTTLSLSEGEGFTLEATITPDNATNKEITWTSDNEAVATVSAEGVVKAIKAGTAKVTATTVDQGKSASCAVTVAAKMGAITGEATHISCRNARLTGKVTPSQNTATNRSFGVLYSTSSSLLFGSATLLEPIEFDADYNYTIYTGVLEPETTYFYRSYIIQNDEVEYGDTKSFKTLALSSMIQTLDADVYRQGATLNAMLDLTDCIYSSIEYGFELTPKGGQTETLTANWVSSKAISYCDENLVMNTGYSYVAYVKLDGTLYKGEPKTFTTPAPPTPTLVDLGLSVKWASFNLGASKPSEYGGYFQWAGTKDVSNTGIYLSLYNCPYHTGSSYSNGWMKYNAKWGCGTLDYKTVLESMDDAASVTLGGKWRIPTDTEWSELRNTSNCSWTWTSIDGVNGYKVQSKKPGYTDNWIFLPAAGCRIEDHPGRGGALGYYWSSSL